MNENINQPQRRDFLKSTLLSGVGMITGASELSEKKNPENTFSSKNKPITLLITSDIHAQINTHDEFFWKNGKAIYKKRGGLAVLKTMIEHFRKQNPENTIVYDGGDFFHGHAVSTFTEGEALIPLINHIGYDLILPGNWEVVYKKKKIF